MLAEARYYESKAPRHQIEDNNRFVIAAYSILLVDGVDKGIVMQMLDKLDVRLSLYTSRAYVSRFLPYGDFRLEIS